MPFLPSAFAAPIHPLTLSCVHASGTLVYTNPGFLHMLHARITAAIHSPHNSASIAESLPVSMWSRRPVAS